ncbi:MAG: GAF domain-containing protein, partial [Actinomycetota bacterium]
MSTTEERAEPAGEDRLWALLDAGVSLAGELDLDAVLGRIVDAARTLIGAKYAALGVIDESRRGLSNFVYRGITEAQREEIGRLPVGRGLLGALIDDPRPIRLTDMSKDPRRVGFPANHPPMKSFLGVPVVSKSQVFGNLYLTEKEGGGEFSQEDERLAIALAAQAGVAVENARLYGLVSANEAASRRRLRELEVVQEIGSALLSELDPTRVLRLIAHEALELLGGTATFVAMSEGEDSLTVRVAAGRGAAVIEAMDVDRSGSLIGYAMQVLEPVMVEDVTTDPRRTQITQALKGRSTIVAPLIDRRKAVGVLGVVHTDPGYFKHDDLFVARRFADLGSLALRNAHYIVTERDRAQMEAELAEAQLREQMRGDTLHAVIRAQEDERARVARELHDSAGQAMASILLSLKIVDQQDSIE